MNLARSMSLGARVSLGTAWAMCMVVLGLSLVLDGTPLPSPGRHPAWATLLGLASMSGGLFVFMAMVADRLIPSIGRRMTMWWIEMSMAGALLACGVGAILLAFSRGTPT